MRIRFIGLLFCCFMFFHYNATAQDLKKKFTPSVSGVMGVSYEGYGLSRNPSGWMGYTPRRPWNQVRFNITPTIKFSPNFSLPFNFNFSALPNPVLGPFAGVKKPSIGQFISNPLNNFGLNPKYKWAELLLGTQYLKYSDLSTGDIGIFGAGIDLRPKNWRIKFFTGTSQQGVGYAAGPPSITGSYKRQNWMAQLGNEKEGKYLVAINFAKGRDATTSATPLPLTLKPQEGFVMSLQTDLYLPYGLYIKFEGARSVFTKNLFTPLDSSYKSFKPFIEAHTSTVADYATQASIGRKSKNFDIGITTKYLGAGFQTTGYPYQQSDRLDYTINTRFNAWKSKDKSYKMNVVASVGQRLNNVSNTSLKAKQFIGNLNWFTQFDDHWSLNVNYNNFGFETASGINPFGIKNVSNDLGFNPTYNWSNSKMNNLLSLSYNYSKYNERDVLTGLTTSNNTHTALLTWVPTFFTKELSPDFSILYFYNNVPGAKLSLTTISSGLGMPAAKKRLKLRGQLQYTIGKLNSFSKNSNLVASCNVDVKLNKKLTWTNFMTTNYFKYGNEIIPNGAHYLESTIRTGFQYRFEPKFGK